MRLALLLLTRNGVGCIEALARSGAVARLFGKRVVVVDTESCDGTGEAARRVGWAVCEVRWREFDHGGARRLALSMARELFGDLEGVVYVTQDARVHAAGWRKIVECGLARGEVGAAYGRQVPRPGARPFEAHARLFNYPDRSEIRSLEDAKRLGIKACFFSDSFAAYRVEALEQVGGFPERAIVGEDVIVAARLLKAGWKIAYVADACVYHSHDLTPTQEMRRYFDIGVFHAREEWILREFGNPEGEGLRFLLSELRYLWQHAPWLIPESFLRAGLKYLGYRLGRAERWLPLWFKRWLSLQKHFWDREAEELRRPKRRADE